jgi:hypothetical protein
MPSERQLNANRRNAALGGPKTPEGRAAVRFNAVDHGLAARITILPGESPEGFQELRQDLFQDYLPANSTERFLFEEFARCSWKLLRLRRVETELWTGYILAMRRTAGAHEAPTQQETDRALAGALAEVPPKELQNFFRYDRAITRDFYRVLHELQAAQRDRRRSQPIPAEPRNEKLQNEPEQHITAAATATSGAVACAAEVPAPLSANGIGTVLQTPDSAPVSSKAGSPGLPVRHEAAAVAGGETPGNGRGRAAQPVTVVAA